MAALLAALAWAPAGQATFTGRDGDLLWLLDPAHGGPDQLWVTGPDGRQPRRVLTRSTSGATCNLYGGASFTRSGDQIIFQEASNCDGAEPTDYVLELANLDGTRPRALGRFSSQTPPASGFYDALPGFVSLSPDGRALAYGYQRFSHQRDSYEVVYIDLKTGRRTRSITIPGLLSGPWWIASDMLLFLTATGSIEATRADGSHPHHIKVTLPYSGLGVVPDSILGVVPSPDGQQLILTVGNENGACGYPGQPQCMSNLYLVPLTGGTAKRLTRSGTASGPVWSPNEHQIAFHDGRVNRLMTLATGKMRTLNERIPRGGLGVVDWQALP